ncbi:hypothetical protein ACFYUD_30605 [Nocardia tengchongensis]|uniref:hypothetical protein n=1 Tax=Nocardia tengchongensis TaxID=2055889 RepID=UPI0036A0C789
MAMEVTRTADGLATSTITVSTRPIVQQDWTPVWSFHTDVDLSANEGSTVELIRQRDSAWVFVNRLSDNPRQLFRGDHPLMFDGARLLNGQWSKWIPPCRDGLPAMIGVIAPTPADLLALCTPVMNTDAPDSNKDVHLIVSHDAGMSYTDAGVVSGYWASFAAAFTPDDIVLSTSSGPGTDPVLRTTHDGGRHWDTSYTPPSTRTYDAGYVTFGGDGSLSGDRGFLPGSQAYLIETTRRRDGPVYYRTRLLMTRDTGRSWTAIPFPL